MLQKRGRETKANTMKRDVKEKALTCQLNLIKMSEKNNSDELETQQFKNMANTNQWAFIRSLFPRPS